MPIYSRYWQQVPNWWVAATTGDNRNKGDDVTRPLKTWAELRRRVGARNGLLLQPTTITVPEGLPVGDPMLVDFGVDTNSVTLTDGLQIVGPLTDVGGSSGTVATARPRNKTATPAIYNGITATAYNWTPHIAVDRIVCGTGGAINGAFAWVANDDGGGAGTLSSFNISPFTEPTITNGDTFKIQQLVTVDSGIIRPSKGPCLISGFVFTNPTPVIQLNRPAIRLRNCSMLGPMTYSSGYFPSLLNCRFQVSNASSFWAFIGSNFSIFAGLCYNTSGVNATQGAFSFTGAGNSSIGGGALFWNSSITVDIGGFVSINDAMIKGGTLNHCGLRVYRHGHVLIATDLSGQCAVPGAPYGIQMDHTAHVVLQSNGAGLNLVGSTPGVNDIIIGNVSVYSIAQARAGIWNSGGSAAYIGPQV